jgi:hypothetical protein
LGCTYVDPDGHQGTLREYAKRAAAATAQVVKDTAVGFGKEVYNSYAALNNAVNDIVNVAISPATNFRFGHLPLAQASTPGERSAMIGTALVSAGAGLAQLKAAATAARAGELAGATSKFSTKFNCVNCAIATDATLAGRPCCPMPGGPTSVKVLEEMFGGKFLPVISKDVIVQRMLTAGNGARGIISAKVAGSKFRHTFNVVNENGKIRFIDRSTREAIDWSALSNFELLRTN